MKAKLLIGTYTTGGDSKGIYETELDLESGRLSPARLAITQRDPSYLALSEDGKRLYAVDETLKSGNVLSYSLSQIGFLQTGCEPSGGSSPCHVMLNETQNMLAVANYMDGAVTFFSLDESGALNGKGQIIALTGSGPNAKRQECAHAHQCVAYEGGVLLSDLGTDQVRVFNKDSSGKYLEKAPLLHTRPGAGPRHMILSGDGKMLYLLCELQNVLYAFEKTPDGFKEKDVFAYLPKDTPPAFASAVRLSDDERFLFASSRGGYNGVALFELHDTTRLPVFCGLYPCGVFPRDILPVHDYLVCACQEGNTLQVMKLDRTGKKLDFHSEISMPKPTCILKA